MKPCSVAIVGAAETTELGVIPNTSQLELHCDAALNAMTVPIDIVRAIVTRIEETSP